MPRLSIWLQYVSCFAGDLVPSPPGDRVDGHRELVGGGLPLQADGLPQVSRVILLSCHRDLGLLQNIRLLRFGIHPHRYLLGQVREDVCKDAIKYHDHEQTTLGAMIRSNFLKLSNYLKIS